MGKEGLNLLKEELCDTDFESIEVESVKSAWFLAEAITISSGPVENKRTERAKVVVQRSIGALESFPRGQEILDLSGVIKKGLEKNPEQTRKMVKKVLSYL